MTDTAGSPKVRSTPRSPSSASDAEHLWGEFHDVSDSIRVDLALDVIALLTR
jgi:hypothetical protein